MNEMSVGHIAQFSYDHRLDVPKIKNTVKISKVCQTYKF